MSGKIYDYLKRMTDKVTKSPVKSQEATTMTSRSRTDEDDLSKSKKRKLDAEIVQGCSTPLSNKTQANILTMLTSNNRHKENGTSKLKKEEVDQKEEQEEENGVNHKDDDDDDEGGEEYEVETILDYQICKERNTGLYEVKWVGWPSEDNTWEPEDNLDCKDKLVEFYLKRVEERNNASRHKKRDLPLPPDPRTMLDYRQDFLRENYTPPSREKLDRIFRLHEKKLMQFKPDSWLYKELDQLAKKQARNEARLKAAFDQLDLREMKRRRQAQLDTIKAWETEINNADPDAKISVFNEVDLEEPPTHMTYINHYLASPGIVIPEDPLIGCECNSCGPGSNCCSTNAGCDFAYSAHGKVKITVGFAIYECNKRCKCPPTCRNRVVQKGRQFKMAIYRTDNGCGWGVKTLDKIKAGSFVVHYVGEVINSEEAERRGLKYDSEGRTYLFDLDFNMGEENLYTVDAAQYGNISHFINHSCDPNLSIYNVYINCIDPNLPQLCLFARRDINKGEQLTFDYCQSTQRDDDESMMESPSKVGMSPSLAGTRRNASEDDGHATCKCGAKNCRKVLFQRPSNHESDV